MWLVNSVFLLVVADCGDKQKLAVIYHEEASVSTVQLWKNKLEHPFLSPFFFSGSFQIVAVTFPRRTVFWWLRDS